MSADRIRELLDAAGVDASALGAAESLSFPAATVDEARAPLREGAVREAPLGVRSDVLATIGLSATLDRAASRLAFTSPADLAFTIEPPASADGVPTDAPLDFVITAGDAGPLAFGEIRAGGLRLQSLHAWPAPPLDLWREAIGEAEWQLLAGEDGLAETGMTRWTATLIAGRIARLLVPPDAAPLIAARKWPRSLTAAHRCVDRALRRGRLPGSSRPASSACRTRSCRTSPASSPAGARSASSGTISKACASCCARPGPARRSPVPCSRPMPPAAPCDSAGPRMPTSTTTGCSASPRATPAAWWAGTRRRAFVL